jgi:hypothetical protein
MGQTKRRHHYVPVSLLAGFTKKDTKDSVLWIFDQETGEQRETKPKSVGLEKDLYSIDIPELETDEIENAFMEIESIVTPIIRKIQSTLEMPTGDEYINLMYYIALQYSRTPKRKEGFSRPMEDIAKIFMQMSVSSRQRYEKTINDLKMAGKEIDNLPYDDMHRFVMNEDAYDVIVDNNTKMSNIFTVIDAILPTLFERKWSVVFSPPAIGDFICSDNPVSLHWTTLEKRPGLFNSPGHGMTDTEISIPLSSRVMLLGRFDDFQPPSGVVPNKRNLAILNSITGIESSRFIYSRKNDFYWYTKDGQVANVEDFKRKIQENDQAIR